MVPLVDLWLPIVVSGVVMYFAGFVAWMLLPHHRSDWRRLPDEDGFLADLKRQDAPAPGQYTFPHCGDPSQMKDPAWQQKLKEGPAGFLVLFPRGGQNMVKNMVLYILYCMAISLFAAYVASHCLSPGASYLEVFRVVGTAAMLGYAGALPSNAIWFGRSWSSTIKEMLDGVVYGLLTAGIFGWLWP
jgi:hypothetical protein